MEGSQKIVTTKCARTFSNMGSPQDVFCGLCWSKYYFCWPKMTDFDKNKSKLYFCRFFDGGGSRRGVRKGVHTRCTSSLTKICLPHGPKNIFFMKKYCVSWKILIFGQQTIHAKYRKLGNTCWESQSSENVRAHFVVSAERWPPVL